VVTDTSTPGREQDGGLVAAAPLDVQVVEVSARDGLQNDPAELTTAQKVELVRRTTAAGLTRQEVASFVDPVRVPRMADAEAVVAALAADAGRASSSYIGLVLNVRGFERAAATRIDEVNLVVAASEAFTERNQGMSVDDAVRTVEQVVPLARAAGLVPTVTVSTSFGCPFEGEVPTSRLVALAERLAASGVEEIALADTIGVAVPRDVRDRVRGVRSVTDGLRLRAHFHNTRNTGYANALTAYEEGVRVLDSSLGGIGGCPFAPKATGNIATEDLVYLLERSGVSTGLDLDALIAASEWLATQLGRQTPSLVAKAGGFPTP
jgi:hydroxymethylglutaryl-CoA lyase